MEASNMSISASCAACHTLLETDASLVCVICSEAYHHLCVNIPTEKYTGLSKEFKRGWCCPSCHCKQPRSDNTNTPVRAHSASAASASDNVTLRVNNRSKIHTTSHSDACFTEEKLRNIIKSELVEVVNHCLESMVKKYLGSQLREIKDELASFKNSISFISEKYEDVLCRTQEVQVRVSSLEERISTLEAERKYYLSLESKIDGMEQQARQCNIEISNIPERRNENLSKLVEQLGVAIKHTIKLSDVVSAHRVPHASTNNSHPKNIIVKFNTRVLRDNVLAAARMHKNLLSDSLGVAGDPRKVYVNEHLTLKNKHLFRETREAAKTHNYRYVWIKNGTVLVRESDTSPVFAVRTAGDIARIKSKPA